MPVESIPLNFGSERLDDLLVALLVYDLEFDLGIVLQLKLVLDEALEPEDPVEMPDVPVVWFHAGSAQEDDAAPAQSSESDIQAI